MKDDVVVLVGNKPVMNYVLAVMTQLERNMPTVTLKARGQSISRAVDAAEVIRNRFIPNLKIKDITIRTDVISDEQGNRSNVSSLEIVLTTLKSDLNDKTQYCNCNGKELNLKVPHNLDQPPLIHRSIIASTNDQAQRVNRFGDKYYIAKNYKAALNCYVIAAKIDPNNEIYSNNKKKAEKAVDHTNAVGRPSQATKQGFQNNEIENNINIHNSIKIKKNRKKNKHQRKVQPPTELTNTYRSKKFGVRLDNSVTDLFKLHKIIDPMKPQNGHPNNKVFIESNYARNINAHSLEIQQYSAKSNVIEMFLIGEDRPIIAMQKQILDVLKPIGGCQIRTEKYKGWLIPKELTIKAVDALSKLGIVDRKNSRVHVMKTPAAVNSEGNESKSSKWECKTDSSMSWVP